MLNVILFSYKGKQGNFLSLSKIFHIIIVLHRVFMNNDFMLVIDKLSKKIVL